jgi:hypothetical protein
MQGESHVIVSMVKTDFDGAWGDGAKEFQIVQPLKGKKGTRKATLTFLSRQQRQN